MSSVSDSGSAMHSFRLAEMRVNAAVFTALATAAIWVTMSSHERPSSSIRTMAPIWPWARLIRLVIAATCSSSRRICGVFFVAILSPSMRRRLIHVRYLPGHVDSSVCEVDLWQESVEPAGQPPCGTTSQAQEHRDEHQSHQECVEEYRRTKDDSHLLRGKGTRERKGEEHRNHHGRCREDDSTGVGNPIDHGILRVTTEFVVLFRTREKKDCVVHGDGEDHGKEEHRTPRVKEPLRHEAEECTPVAILKDETSNAKRTSGRQKAGDDANRGNEQRTECNDEQ